jgi:xyloglucan galactosyltransferase MUR3
MISIFVLLVLIQVVLASKSFYIYDWPQKLDDVWPPAGAELHKQSGYDHAFRPNLGMGKILDIESGLFQTWQFAQYRAIMNRLRVSEFRTRDPSKASAFIVPYDIGVNSYIDCNDGRPRLAAPHGRMAFSLLADTCKGSDRQLYWDKNGHDHFLINSITYGQMVGIAAKEMFMKVCQNCSVISIETSPTGLGLAGRTRKRWFAAPYPSSFHWHEDLKYLPWAVPGPDEDRSAPDFRLRFPERNIFVLFIGSVKASQAGSRALRQALYAQCKSNTDSNSKPCVWHETTHSCNGIVNATNAMLLFRRAVFCPAPAGDSITRKSIFDALVAGCIPVIFSRATLGLYSWHVPPADLERVAVYIPMEGLVGTPPTNFLDVLRAIPADVIAAMQRRIAELAPSLQYSAVPPRLGDLDSAAPWRPPVRDAVDVIIDRMLDPATVEPLAGYSDAELIEQHDAATEILNTHEDYLALRGKPSPRQGIDGGKAKGKRAQVIEKGKLPKSLTQRSRICDV